MKDDQKVIAEVQRGAQHYICFDCGDKYRPDGKECYSGSITVHNGMCAICHKPEHIGSSRKIMGFYKML